MIDETLARLDALIAKGETLITPGTGDYSWVNDRGRLSEFRSLGLTLLKNSVGSDDHRYTDFADSSGQYLVLDVKKALGVLRAVRESIQAGDTPIQSAEIDTGRAGNPRSVAVVYGRNEGARQAIFTFLRSVGLEPQEWSHAVVRTGTASPFIGEVLDGLFAEAQAVVILLTGDDEAWLRPSFRNSDDPPYEHQLTPQARPNVLFEAGMAFGRHPKRSILVQLGATRPFSDIAGRFVIKLADDIPSRQTLIAALSTAGCPVSSAILKTDWHHAGDFGAAIQSSPSHDSVNQSASVAPTSVARALELLLTEIGENKKLSGRMASRLQHRHLDAVVQMAERMEIDRSHPEIMAHLRLLKRTTEGQLSMEGYGSSAGALMKSSYVPVAESAERALREFVDSLLNSTGS